MNDNDIKTIEHNPHETRFNNRYLWCVWAVVAAVWLFKLFGDDPTFPWTSIGMGFITGQVFTVTAVHLSKGILPDWYRRMYD